jgi:hypothetical protein
MGVFLSPRESCRRGGDRRAVGPDNTYEFHFRVVLKGSREASRKALRMAFFSGEGGASSPDPP